MPNLKTLITEVENAIKTSDQYGISQIHIVTLQGIHEVLSEAMELTDMSTAGRKK